MMKGTMKENLSMIMTDDVKEAAAAIKSVLRKSYFKIGYYTCGYDVDTYEILFFFPIEKVYALDYGRYQFVVELTNAWKAAGYKIVETGDIPKYEYRRVGFASKYFRLKKVYYEV